MHKITTCIVSGTFFVLASICVFTLIFVAKLIPETKGKKLEEVHMLISNVRQWWLKEKKKLVAFLTFSIIYYTSKFCLGDFGWTSYLRQSYLRTEVGHDLLLKIIEIVVYMESFWHIKYASSILCYNSSNSLVLLPI